MAEWRALGFVPDSDEEDDSQTSDSIHRICLQRDSHDIHEPGKDAKKDGGNDGQRISPSGLDDERKEVAEESTRRSTSDEDIKAVNLSERDGENRFLLTKAEYLEPAKVALGADDIDELQHDHYEVTSSSVPSRAQVILAVEINESTHSIAPRLTPHTQWDSPLSSPLTEPPLSPVDPVAELSLENIIPGPPERLVDSHSTPEPGHPNTKEANLTAHADDGIPNPYRASRNLRHRNPIQLHPYAIEGEKYRQVLKARGVKPLRIAHIQESLESQAFENAEVEADQHGQPLDPEAVIITSPSSFHQQLNSSPTSRINSSLDEEEFPEVSAILRHQPSHVVVGATKRRKVLHTFSKKGRRSSQQMRGLEGPETPPLSTDSIFDILHSPTEPVISARRDFSPPANRGFRVPLGAIPINLPTPATSSEPRIRPTVQLRRSRSPTIEISTDSSSEENEDLANVDSDLSENEADPRLEHVQRKMRGVLPASWLKLDLKTQKKQPEHGLRAQLHGSPGKSEAQRGVARPVLVSQESQDMPMGKDFPIVVSDDEKPDSVCSEFIRPASPDEHSFSADNIDGIYNKGRGLAAHAEEVLEDNRVNAMLPSTKRLKNYKKKRKHQSNLAVGNGVKSRPIRTSHLRHSRVKRVYQPRITEHMKKGEKKKVKFRPPNLSVLDAPSHRMATNTPHFLKVASRTARSRLDKGRHSPSHKFVRLATNSDTTDALETLRNWREGTILPVRLLNGISANKNSELQPLHAQSGNGQPHLHPVPFLKDVQRNGPGPIGARLPKAKSLPVARPGIQTSLDHIIQRQLKDRRYAGDRIRRLRKHRSGIDHLHNNGHLVTSLRNSNDSRPALLESLQEDDDRIHPEAAFRRHVMKGNHILDGPGASNVMLDRFLESNVQTPEIAQSESEPRRRGDKSAVPSRSRKRPPRRMNVESHIFRQMSPSVHVDITTDHQTPLTSQEVGTLHGLGSFGTKYTRSFDILPLPVGIYLHSSTFIGSGRFYASLQLHRHAKMDVHRGLSTFHIGQESFKWGPWNDQVSTQLGMVSGMISDRLQLISRGNYGVGDQQISSLLMNIINYFSDSLSFLDQIDRVSCLHRCKALLWELLSEFDAQTPPPDKSQQQLRLYTLTLFLVFTNQLSQLSTHELVPQVLRDEITKMVLDTAQKTLYPVLNERFESLPECLENLGHLEACEYGIREDSYSVEAVVVVHHVLRESSESLTTFWEIVRNSIMPQASNRVTEVAVLERNWRKLFTILPFLGFDAQGILDSDQRFKISNDGWPLAKQLTSDVLQLHILYPSGQGANFNVYCRALFGRCLHLVNAWGWNRCESIIGMMFDFFARNDLAHLSNEECRGSPRFLEHLDGKPDLKASPEDRCFHIFLKIIGSSLGHLRKLHPEKKLRDIVWRLMPNHGRLHPKEETLCRRDLDAWRNHHDLLSTLYWASPPAVRPRISVIRNLVLLESSHREACHINIRAWSNLVRFQLSTDEDISALKPFADWHDDFMEQLLRQHYSARTEAEDQAYTARYNGDPISNEVLETTIARNQRQVAVMLSDALVSLKVAMDAVRNMEQAIILLTPALVHVFDLFDSRSSYSNKNIGQALDVVLTYANQSLSRLNKPTNQDPNDDSQDYGDWSAFDDDALPKEDQLLPRQQDSAATHLLSSFHEPIKQLLSNSFGADTVPEDTLLLKIIEVWVYVSRILVRNGTRTWNDFISPFGTDCWDSLRRTEQTQKFTNYYLAILIEHDANIYQEHRSFFLASWIDALVERESMIKFQHRFTSDILNAGSEDPLMRNLPFWMDSDTSRFSISASDFLGRRVSLISSLLSNMRESLEDAHQGLTSNLPILRQEYQTMVKHLMNAMKRNYQELGHGSNARGSYVEFVQRIIGFLQQHTLDLCPIDRFFTDSTAFPLPAADPTYVIGRLKNYGLRLQDSRTPKQLAVFLQSVSERAAVDGVQRYLVGQLYTAMSNVVERGDLAKPTLQSFLIEAIVPAYIDVAFSTSCGWLLASPLLKALRKIFGGLLTSLDGTDVASVAGVVSIISAFLGSARSSMELLIDHSGLLEQSHTLRLLGLIYSSITALLPTLDYIVRLSNTAPPVVEFLDFFESFANFSSEVLLKHEDVQSPNMKEEVDCIPQNACYREIRDFALRELRDSLGRNWVCRDGNYYVARGNMRQEVVLNHENVLPFSEEKARLLKEYVTLRACFNMMPALGCNIVREIPDSKNRSIAAGDD